MQKLIFSILLIASILQTAYAQGLLQPTFGSGAGAFSMDFVTIGNPNNAADTTGSPNPAGSVSYVYGMSKYEICREIIDKANLGGNLGITMADMKNQGGNGSNKPATGISWYEAARFVNYLNTCAGYPPAYKFDGSGNFQLWTTQDSGYVATNPFRNAQAKYFLPNTDEWYKAAYGGYWNGGWYNYPIGNDAPPTAVASSVNYGGVAVFGGQTGPADVTSAASINYYGTIGMGGNVSEWTESAYDLVNDTVDEAREIRGGSWLTNSNWLNCAFRTFSGPSTETSTQGFRVAMVVAFTLTTSSDTVRGTISRTPNASIYYQNDIVSIEAIPNAGYVFVNWTGDSSATTSLISLTINSNKSLVASFSEDNADNDADGLSNYQESVTYGTNPNQKDSNGDGVEDGQAVSMGYNPTLNFSALIAHPPTGLYTASQMQAIAIGDLVLTKNVNGSFTLNYDIEQSTDLQSWLPYQSFNMTLTNLPPDKAFIRIKARQ
jgi:formylglycine-generating enzyme